MFRVGWVGGLRVCSVGLSAFKSEVHYAELNGQASGSSLEP